MARPFPKSPVGSVGEKDGHTAGDTVGCALKTRAALITSVWISLSRETACVPSSGFFFAMWGIFIGFYSVLVLVPQDRGYSLYPPWHRHPNK